MADHSVPDYDLADTLRFDSPTQYKALFEDTRSQIIDLLNERAATIKGVTMTFPRWIAKEVFSPMVESTHSRQQNRMRMRHDPEAIIGATRSAMCPSQA